MNQKLYIQSACAISPQHTFGPEHFLQPLIDTDTNKLFIIDQDYRKYISPVAIRRMSRILKMSISTGMQCLQIAGIDRPDGIITGTGKGSVTDMEHFLKDMIAYKEEALNPTYFIQSTYNSVNGWLALQTKCIGYNQTYVHRGFSFELALLDASLLLKETDETKHYLVGCYDEITDEYYHVKSKIGYWKKEPVNNLDLLNKSSTAGTIAGEGAAFFTVSNDKGNAVCSLGGIKMLQESAPENIQSSINQLLQGNGLLLADIDVVLCGINGDKENKLHYDSLLNQIPAATTICAFKHLSGEYDTASGFAAWLAVQLFSRQQVPDIIKLRQGQNNDIKHILIINSYMQNNMSLILLNAEK